MSRSCRVLLLVVALFGWNLRSLPAAGGEPKAPDGPARLMAGVAKVDITNTTDRQVNYSVSRSECRCLFYEYTGKLGPKKKETLSVTVDGAKAKPGALMETISITAKKDPSIATSFQVTANIK